MRVNMDFLSSTLFRKLVVTCHLTVNHRTLSWSFWNTLNIYIYIYINILTGRRWNASTSSSSSSCLPPVVPPSTTRNVYASLFTSTLTTQMETYANARSNSKYISSQRVGMVHRETFNTDKTGACSLMICPRQRYLSISTRVKKTWLMLCLRSLRYQEKLSNSVRNSVPTTVENL